MILLKWCTFLVINSNLKDLSEVKLCFPDLLSLEETLLFVTILYLLKYSNDFLRVGRQNVHKVFCFFISST